MNGKEENLNSRKAKILLEENEGAAPFVCILWSRSAQSQNDLLAEFGAAQLYETYVRFINIEFMTPNERIDGRT